jgi:RNA polymerase sigma-70 factor (ECF subfamily)
MPENDWLAERFQENRSRLRRVAYRILGSTSEADDAIQEAWMRVSRFGASGVEHLGGWLTTTVARVCLDMLRSRRSQRHGKVAETHPGASETPTTRNDPEAEMLLAESVGPALLIVLETLAPAERVAFVLHDMFDLSFEEIAPIVGRSPVAARQLASRGRRRVQGGSAVPDAELVRHREVVNAFFAASKAGEFDSLLAVLAPDVVLRADETAVQTAAANRARGAPSLSKEARGARAVFEAFKGRAQGALPALIDGAAGAVWAQGGQTRAVFAFTIEGGKIVEIDLLMDPGRLGQLEVAVD